MTLRRLLLLSLPATVVAGLLSAILIKAWVRTQWDSKRGTPVASTTRAFLHYRPSQMPGASGHSWGNANRVKADALFAYLKALLPEGRIK